MYVFDLKVGYSCNNDCIHCIITLNRDKIIQAGKACDRTFEECIEELNKANQQRIAQGESYSKVVLTGGEVTIRNDVFQLCDHVMENGFTFIEMQTNGRALAEFSMTKKLIDTYPMIFAIALHGPNATIHDQVTKRKGSFAETVQGLQNIMECGGNLVGKIVISKKNYSVLLDTVKLFHQLKAKYINIAFPHSSIGDPRFADYVPRYSEVQPYILDVLEYAKREHLPLQLECVPFCFLEGYEEYTEYADAFWTKQKKIFTSAVQSASIDWQKRRLEIKDKAKVCADCFFHQLCEGVWTEYIHYYGEDEFVGITDLSKFAKVLSKMEKLNKHKAPNKTERENSDDCKS